MAFPQGLLAGSDPKGAGAGRVKTRTAPRPHQAFGLGGRLSLPFLGMPA